MAFLCSRDALLGVVGSEELGLERTCLLDLSTSLGARAGLCSPLGLGLQGQRQFCQQEPSQEVLLSERPTQLEHTGYLGVRGLAGEGGALQRAGRESRDGRSQGSRVRGERLVLTITCELTGPGGKLQVRKTPHGTPGGN